MPYKNKEDRNRSNRESYARNKKSRKAHQKSYYEANTEKVLMRQSVLYRTPKGRFNHYKADAKKENRKWGLTFDQFIAFWQKPCGYCGRTLEFIGLDRRDNSKGYTLGNVVSCCWVCNRMKGEMNAAVFVGQCAKVQRFIGAKCQPCLSS